MARRPDILCISSIDWDFIWQGHQEIMSRLAGDGHRVLFIENTGVRSPRLSDLPRLRQRLRNWRRGTKGFRQERPNLFVHSPMVLPPRGTPAPPAPQHNGTAYWIKVSAQTDGSFTVTNGRNGFSKTYRRID